MRQVQCDLFQKSFFSILFINSYLQGLLASTSSWHIILHLSIPGNMRKKQSSWQMLFFDVDAWKGCIIFFTSFLKRSLFSSFFGAFYDCYEIAVLWFEQKIFLCCIKGKEQRYFRNSAQNNHIKFVQTWLWDREVVVSNVFTPTIFFAQIWALISAQIAWFICQNLPIWIFWKIRHLTQHSKT